MKTPFVDLQIEYQTIKADIDAAITDVLAHSDFVLGRAVGEFEEAFAVMRSGHSGKVIMNWVDE